MERLELAYYYGQEGEQFTFYRLPKALITDPRFKDISNNAKLLYGLMLDRMGLSVRSGWFDDQNRVYIKYAVKNIMQDLNISKVTAVGLLKELQGIGLIDMIQRNGLANIIYNPGMYDMIQHLFLSNKIIPKVYDYCNSHLTSLLLASFMKGSVIIPKQNICHLKLYHGLVCRKIDNPCAYHEIGVAWNKKNMTPVLDGFLRALNIEI